MPLVSSFLLLVQQMGAGMTSPSLASLVTVVTGWLYAGRRTVTGIIVAAGAIGQKHHSAYHRLFASARWSLNALGLALVRLLSPLLQERPVPLSLDDTLARKRGLKVYGAGMHHDPLASSRKLAVTSWGHSWVVLAVRVELPCIPGRFFSLPVLFRLYLNRKASARSRRVHKSRPELGVELLEVLCGAFPALRFHVFADSTYGGQSVLKFLPANCDMTSRLPLDARLYEAPAPRRPGAPGRPRKRGARLPTPAQLLKTRARRATLSLYGREDKVRLAECVAHWHSVPHRPLKVVAVEPRTGGRPVQAFYSTRVEQQALEVLGGYAGRWSIEEAFLGAKQHLGFEEPQGWSRQAVLRTAPMAMLLYSLVVVWFARGGHAFYQQPYRPWYLQKARPSFADMLATLKQESLREEVSAYLPPGRVRDNLLTSLLRAAHAAA